jgi:hypothetical protein
MTGENGMSWIERVMFTWIERVMFTVVLTLFLVITVVVIDHKKRDNGPLQYLFVIRNCGRG